MSGLLALSPGMISMPLSPPLRADSRLSRRKWLLGLSGPWQRKQVFSKIGLISASNAILTWAAGGSLLGSREGAANRAGEPNAASKIWVRSLIGLTWFRVNRTCEDAHSIHARRCGSRRSNTFPGVTAGYAGLCRCRFHRSGHDGFGRGI